MRPVKKICLISREDIGEKNNLVLSEPGLVNKKSKELGRYMRNVNAQRPSYKATGKEVPWSDEV